MSDTSQNTKTVNADNQSASDESTVEEIVHLQELEKVYRSRLRTLEIQSAKFGSSTPPHILVEIEDLRENLVRIQEQVKKFQAVGDPGTAIIKHGQDGISPEDMFKPEWSVLRSKIRYVDANLALKYADASQDVNIMLGFLTLFLGSAISFVVSLVTSNQPNETMLLATATAFSILLTLVFGALTIRAWVKAESAKKQLFESGDLKQLPNQGASK